MASLHTVVFVGLVGTLSSSGPPAPVGVVVVIDAKDTEQFNTAISITQNFAVIPESKISVVSDQGTLLVKENIELDDEGYRMELTKLKYKTTSNRELTLPKLKTIAQGHFTNDNGNHRKAQILCILTGHKYISGNFALIQDIRRIKTFVIGLGFSSDQFSPQFMDLAADQNHKMAIQTPQDLDKVIDKWKKQISTDSHFVCHTDRYNNPTMKNCYSECSRICETTKNLYSLCRKKCPFFKEVNVTKYSYVEDEQSGSYLWIVPVSFAVVSFIVLVIVVFRYRKSIIGFIMRGLKRCGKKQPEERIPLNGNRDIVAQQEVGDSMPDDQSDRDKIGHVAKAIERGTD